MEPLIANLRAAAGAANVLAAPDELLVYECDGLTQYRQRPRAVVFPPSTEATAEVVKVLTRAGVSFAPRGAGTGLSGGALALDGGVVIELARLRRLLKVDAPNRLAIVETGMVNAQLSRAVAGLGLHYVPDPSSGAACTIGGNIAENAGGIHCLKYGTTTDHILALRVVLSDGTIVDLGGATGQPPGYDLRGVFIGSEGTFGIATEATVRLVPLPTAVQTLLADFTDVHAASRAVSAIIAAGLVPAALEMLDGATIRAVEASVFAAGLPPDAEAALLIELDGLAAGLADEAAHAAAVCRAHGARHVRLAADEHERKQLWAARKGAFGAMGRLAPDLTLQDAVVPRSQLPAVLADIYRIGAHYRLRLANVFHAGDGNLHPLICFDQRDADEVRRVEAASREIIQTCVRAGGTITGEHGVGLDKRAYLPLVCSAADLTAMLQVRAAFDPTGLCNPGKIIPAPRGCGEARAVAQPGAQAADATATEQHNQQPHAQAYDAAGPEPPRPAAHTAPLTPEMVLRELTALVGAAHVTDAQGVVTAAPATTDEACALLRFAAAADLAVVPAGAGTWLDAGQPLARPAVIIATRRMTRLSAHEPADLVVTAEAGLTLAALNEATGRAGQWLPLDPPAGAHATLGGLAATGAGGAQSFGYGRPRAFVLGLSVALAGGQLLHAGGRVVKNVAGYDLCKLFVGSYGTLGLITELTLKLRPRPTHEATIMARAGRLDELLAGARQLLAGQFLPVAVELLAPPLAAACGLAGAQPVLLVRCAGTAAAVADQSARAHALLRQQTNPAAVEILPADAELWQTLAAQTACPAESVGWCATVRPTELPALFAAVRQEFGAAAAALRWHAGAGDGRLRVIQPVNNAMSGGPSDNAVAAARLARLRHTAQQLGGSLVIERAPVELKTALDVWGVPAAPLHLMRRVRQQLGAQGFSPGRCAL